VRSARRQGNWLTLFDDFGSRGFRVRLFHLTADGWDPPLPPDIEVPSVEETARSISRSASSRATSARRPAWMLGKDPEPWRLKR